MELEPKPLPWPTAHAWDYLVFWAISASQHSGLLGPLGLAGAFFASFMVAVFCATVYQEGLLFGLTAAALLPFNPLYVLVTDRYRNRAVLRGALDPYQEGRYFGLLTHCYRLKSLFVQLTPLGCMCFNCKVKYTIALVSWQELLGFAALLVWTVVSLTPNCFSSGVPFLSLISWMRMQLDFLWHAKLVSLGQLSAVVIFGLVAIDTCIGWWGRRRDLMASSSLRKGMGFGPGMQVPDWLLPAPGDTHEEIQNKQARLRHTMMRSMKPPNVWERLRFPRPTLPELIWVGSILCGAVSYGGAEWLLPPGSRLLQALLWPRRAAAAWASGLRAMRISVILLTLAAAGAVRVAAGLVAEARRRAWYAAYEKYKATALAASMGRRSLADASDEAWYDTAYTEGRPYPKTSWQLWAWGANSLRFLMGLWFGSVIISWVLYPGYLPAYALPSYRGPTTQLPYVRVGRGMGADLGAGGACAIGECEWTSGVGRWWCDVRAGARVNLLAAWVWKAGGLDGVQVAMEALRAACSREATQDPGLRELAAVTLEHVQVRGWSASAVWRDGVMSPHWELGGRWALGMAWERLSEGWVRRGQIPDQPDGPRAQQDRQHKEQAGSTEIDFGTDVDYDSSPASVAPAADDGNVADAREEDVCSHVVPKFPPWDVASVTRKCGDAGSQCSAARAREAGGVSGPATAAGRYSRAARQDGAAGVGSGGGGNNNGSSKPAVAKKAPRKGGSVPRPSWSVLTNLAVAAPLALWLLAFRPPWLRSPDKFLDAVAGAVQGALGPRQGRAGRGARRQAAEKQSSRKGAPQPVDKAGKRSIQPPSQPPQLEQQSSAKRLLLMGPAESATTAPPPAKPAAASSSRGGKPSRSASDAAAGVDSPAGSLQSSAATADGKNVMYTQRERGKGADRSKGGAAAAAPAPAAVPARSQAPKAAAKPAASAPNRRGGRTAFVRAVGMAAADIAVPQQPVTDAAAEGEDDDAGWQQAGSRSGAVGGNNPSAAAAAVAAALPFTATLVSKLREEQPPPAPRAPAAATASRPAPSHPAAQHGHSFWGWGRAAPPPPAAAQASGSQPSGSRAAVHGGAPTGAEPNLEIPIPVPVPVPPAAAAPPHSAPPTRPAGQGAAAALMGLNPALARFLGPSPPAAAAAAHGAAAPQTAAGAAAANSAAAGSGGGSAAAGGAAPAATQGGGGGFWAAAPGMDPSKCARCQAAPRQVGILHGNHVHLCFCRECGAGFSMGDPCPLCGQLADRLLLCY